MYRLLISIFFIILALFMPVNANEPSFVSTSPSLTEIMYAINAQSMLKAVSSQCNYPEEAKLKPVIGDTYFLNEEMLVKIKPAYFLAPYSSDFKINKYKRLGIKPLCFKFESIDDIYKAIEELGKLTNKKQNANAVIKDMKLKIESAKKSNLKPKNILYIVSMEPFMTIGGESFISDVIEKSGNHSVTSDLKTAYPAISVEYAIKQNPDIVIINYYTFHQEEIKKLFPQAKIIELTKSQCDVIERTSDRIYKSVEFFANIGND